MKRLDQKPCRSGPGADADVALDSVVGAAVEAAVEVAADADVVVEDVTDVAADAYMVVEAVTDVDTDADVVVEAFADVAADTDVDAVVPVVARDIESIPFSSPWVDRPIVRGSRLCQPAHLRRLRARYAPLPRRNLREKRKRSSNGSRRAASRYPNRKMPHCGIFSTKDPFANRLLGIG
ncbi:hypothetical protein J19TS2_43350 [Cohnella xylanilytica]|nr:hypothetical protein J19TS2_43350 [Cohnella xylanilytica]